MARLDTGRDGTVDPTSPTSVGSTGPEVNASRRGWVVGARAAVLVALVAGTGAITVAQASGEPTTARVSDASLLELRGQDVASRGQATGRLSREAVPTRNLTVTVDGATREVSTAAPHVADALAGAGIVLGTEDQVSVALDAPVVPGMSVDITRVTSERVSERAVEKHATVEKKDDDLLAGRTVVETEGVDGVSSVVYEVTTAGGEEIEREMLASVVVSEKVDEVVRVGTKEPTPEPEPAPARSSSSSSSGPSSSASSATDSGPSASRSSTRSAPAFSGDVKALGRDMAAARGWGADQFRCLDSLWTKESNWSHTATNPSSGAYGIPQSLPGSKMATAGADWRSNPATQISWGLDYIAGRYGTPCAAWGHSQAVNWY
ncbi:G5 domain-containing protein [Georgenia sp. 10Sc9-8]|uniref:G5 domain-containing protein n=1 Tax=Georgenia halotolerans TaxID=3028317 RepID=A0ABT5TZX6_9MICO|nr:G5 domain-containing protein [Georgenia halotolerans]